jgi:hemin uptake protein HemP
MTCSYDLLLGLAGVRSQKMRATCWLPISECGCSAHIAFQLVTWRDQGGQEWPSTVYIDCKLLRLEHARFGLYNNWCSKLFGAPQSEMSASSGDDIEDAGKTAGNPSAATRSLMMNGNRIDSRELFSTEREIIIAHGGDIYRLRLTSQNKLILTK